MPTTYAPTICISTALVALVGCPCTADDPVYAELTSCAGVGALEVTAHSPWGEETNTDSDSVASFEDLPLNLFAESHEASAGISADMSMGVAFSGDNAFTLTYDRTAECGVICGGCWVQGSGEMVLDMHLQVNRPTKLRITRWAWWEYDVYPELTLQADGEEPLMLYDPADGDWLKEGEFEELEIRPGTYLMHDELRFVGCGPYKGDGQWVGGYISLVFDFGESDLPADTNLDGVVDGVDLANILGHWGDGSGPGDINGDGAVDGIDLAIALGSWT